MTSWGATDRRLAETSMSASLDPLIRRTVRVLHGAPHHSHSRPHNQQRPRRVIPQTEEVELVDEKPETEIDEPGACPSGRPAAIRWMCVRGKQAHEAVHNQEHRPGRAGQV